MATKKDPRGDHRLRNRTLGFLAATAVLTAAALVVGISDNPPGIILLYGAGLTLVLSLTHRWRRPDRFGLLLLGSVIGFVLMGVLHNFAEVGAHRIPHLPILALLLSGVSVVGFIAAVIVCPVAGAVGLIGFARFAGEWKGRRTG
jgi:hypothetical protein